MLELFSAPALTPDIFSGGIDPGKKGGIFVLRNGYDEVLRGVVPLVGTEYDFDGMLALLQAAPSATMWALERQNPRDGMPAHSTFVIGEGWGMWKAAVRTARVRFQIVHPAVWSELMLAGCPGEKKERNQHAARQLFPHIDLRASAKSTTQHEGLMDALLLAGWMYRARDLPPSRAEKPKKTKPKKTKESNDGL